MYNNLTHKKYKLKYVGNKMFGGGNFVVSESVKHLINVKDNGSLDVSNSVEEFLSGWRGDTPNNVFRSSYIIRAFSNIDTSKFIVNILNPRGNGSCFYECVYVFLKSFVPDFDETYLSFDTENPTEEKYIKLKKMILNLVKNDERFKDLYYVLGLEDPNCPEIEIPISMINMFFGISVCVVSVNTTYKRCSTQKYYEDFDIENSDKMILLLNDGHVYLVIPTNTGFSSSIVIRNEVFKKIM